MTEMTFLKVIYLAGVIGFTAIRRPYQRQWRANIMRDNRYKRTERALLGLIILTMMLLPLIYVFTPFLSSANYKLPLWAGLGGAALFALTASLFWLSHRDLSRNWSPSLQIRDGHELITSGVYAYVRHPMYGAIWLWVLGQALLVQNWIAGPPALVAFGVMYAYRRKAEEQMMLDQFGKAYLDYAARTPRLVPRLLHPGQL